jgi:hypothetical protein
MPRQDGAVPLLRAGRPEEDQSRLRSRGACGLGMLVLAFATLVAALLSSSSSSSSSSTTDGGGSAPAPAPRSRSVACGDAAADNYDPTSTVDPGDNRACAYSCTGLQSHYTLSPTASTCYISSGGSGSGHKKQAWPPQPVEPLRRRAGTGLPATGSSSCGNKTSYCSASEYCINDEYCSSGNNTFTVWGLGPIKGVIIQGYALAGAGRTALTSRADAIGADAALVLRHVSMAGLVAVRQPYAEYGGAVYVFQGTLAAEHALFVGNTAVLVSGQAPQPFCFFLSLFWRLALCLGFSSFSKVSLK